MANRNSLLNDPEQALRLAFDGRLSGLWTNFPAIVTAVDLTKMTISAQPAIQGAIQDENGNITYVNLPILVDVPLKFPSNKNYIITFPIVVGDEVEITIASRCIDAWWQSGGVQKPIEARMHDLSDGFAYPGLRSLPNVAPSISSTDLQIRNNAGTTYVSIASDGKIKLVSPTGIQVTGNLSVTGTITSTGEITAVTTPLHTHAHTGITVGGGTSGVPTR